MTITVCNGDMAASKYKMKKKLGIGIVCISLLLVACGNVTEETVTVGDENTQESDAVKENEKETADSEINLEQGSGYVDEEPETEEPKTEETEPEEPVETSRTVPEKPTYISEEFLGLLKQVLMGEAGAEALAKIVCDYELSEEELEAYSTDPVVAEYIQKAEEGLSRGGRFFIVDGDNDGIDDIFAWIFDGGSMGNSSRCFLQGQADGSFQCTWEDDGTTQEIGFVRYGDITYLLETDFNYDTKIADGFIVNLYQEGDIIESLRLKKVMESYEPDIVHQSAGYEEAAEKYGEEGKSAWEDGEFHLGTAETEINQDYPRTYSSDLDNDGEFEQYWRSVFLPTNIYTRKFLQHGLYTGDGGEGESISILETYGLKYEGIPELFWVDRIGDKNILLLSCYGQEVDKKMLYGYFIEEDTATTVLEIDYVGIPALKYQIYTNGINYGPVYPFGIH